MAGRWEGDARDRGGTLAGSYTCSLAIERETLPDCLAVAAWTPDGEIMGVRHKTLAVEGVQFHPESILSEHGHALLANFIKAPR